MNKKVILFSPIAWEVSDEKIDRLGGTHDVGIQLGVLAAGSILDHDGYEVIVVSGAERYYREKILRHVESGAICLGISCMTGYQIIQGINLIRLIREKNFNLPVIWGGYHPTIAPKQTAESPFVDYVVRGYGERTFHELTQAIENGQGFDQILGITYQKGNEIYHNPDRPIESIDNFPPIPYHLIEVEDFLTQEFGNRTLAYISSRGCPNDCYFCADRIMYQRRWNSLNPNRVLDEITQLTNRYQLDAIRFNDPNFFVNEKRVRELCQGMIDRKLNISWGRVNGSAEVLVNFKTETWELMKQSGLSSILVGAESGYEKALQRINKKAEREQVEELSRLAAKHNIKIIYSMMLGIPIDLSSEEAQHREFRKELAGTLDLIRLVNKSGEGLARTILFRYTPYPGNVLYDDIKNYGWDEPATLEDWGRFNLLYSERPPWLSEEEFSIIDSIRNLVVYSNDRPKAIPQSAFQKLYTLIKRLYRYFILKKSF